MNVSWEFKDFQENGSLKVILIYLIYAVSNYLEIIDPEDTPTQKKQIVWNRQWQLATLIIRLFTLNNGHSNTKVMWWIP